MDDPPNSSSDLQTKGCAEALQSAQKRVRLAFLLTMGASCIVLLMVINLWNSLLVHNKVIKGDTLGKSEYLAEYSKQLAGQSFYQIPSLGIQISCDDVGLLGPLTMLVFSLYSFMTLKACHCHIRCAASARFADNPLVNALLETETLPVGSSRLVKHIFSIPRWLQFWPFLVCLAVAAYCIYAHFVYDIKDDLLAEMLTVTRPTARLLDVIGGLIVFVVALSNWAAFKITKEKEETAKSAVRPGTRGAHA
jgi:hypothetical protein